MHRRPGKDHKEDTTLSEVDLWVGEMVAGPFELYNILTPINHEKWEHPDLRTIL
jgi:hypothetical protein